MFQIASSWYSSLGWIGKTYVVTHAPTSIVWVAGALEGVIRTTAHAAATVFSYLSGNKQTAEKQYTELKRSFNITRGTTALAAVSTIPVVGSYYGNKFLVQQCTQYAKINHALNRAKQTVVLKRLDHEMTALNTKDNISEDDIKAIFSVVNRPVKDVNDLLDKDRQLKGSLVRYFFVYKATYTACEYTCIGIAKGVRVTYTVAARLFSNGLFRKLAKATVVAVRDEYRQTLRMAAVNENYHRIYPLTNKQ